MKVPFFGFVAEKEHASVDTKRAAGGTKEKEKPFGSSVWITTLHRPSLIVGHDEKRDNIDGRKEADK